VLALLLYTFPGIKGTVLLTKLVICMYESLDPWFCAGVVASSL